MKNFYKILQFFTINSLLISCSELAVKKNIPAISDQVISGTITFSSTEEFNRAMNVGKFEIPQSHVLKLKSLTGFNEKNKAEFLKAEIKANEIIQGKCFEDFMLNRKLIQTNGLSNKEVVNKIRTTPIEIDLISYYTWKSVVGYTMTNVKWIKVNSKFYNGSSVCAKASNYSHEGNHKQGFGHDYKKSYSRQFSVPYSINQAFLKCCEK